MRKTTLLTWLSDPDGFINAQEPPERAVFVCDKENEKCCSILQQLITASQQDRTHGNRAALPLPDVDLPLIF
jgi:hypothetical protein